MSETFSKLVPVYLAGLKKRVRESTIKSEASCLWRFLQVIGDDYACGYSSATIEDYQTRRLNDGISASTVNTELVVAHKFFEWAVRRGHAKSNPVKGVKRLKANKPERKFLTNDEINRLCAVSTCVGFVAYIKFLQYTGAREAEALRVKWADVDFQNRRVCIGSDGLSKNGKSRHVDFSEALRAHLESWYRPEFGGSSLVFPSTTRAMRSELERARQKAGLPSVGFHDLRRHFVSQCVMCGIDFATISKWIGHSDGGALLARKYAFLADGFTAKQALRVNF